MQRNPGRQPAWVLVGVVAALVRLGTTAGGPPLMRRTRGPVVRVAPADRFAPIPPPVHVFGGREVDVRVPAGGEAVPWRLVHRQLVLARGTVRPRADGTGRLRLAMPAVRHRTLCRLLCRMGGRWTVTPVHLWPPSLLAPGRGRVAALESAVLDSSGDVQAALAAEGLEPQPFETVIQRMVFDGSLVVLALGDGAALPEDEWDRLEADVRGGLTVLVLNPPAGWRRWGLRAAAVEAPRRMPVRLAPDFRHVLVGEDLGPGPWTLVLHAEAPVIRLAWPAPAQEAETETGVGPMLVAARAVDEGAVAAATVPRLGRTADDPVGRAVLAELLLWAARRHGSPLPGAAPAGTFESHTQGDGP